MIPHSSWTRTWHAHRQLLEVAWMTQPARIVPSVVLPGTGNAGRVHMTLKLYASLTQYLPEPVRKGHAMSMEVDASATIESIIAPLGMPTALVKLVVLNG